MDDAAARTSLLDLALTAIESIEASSLAWGFVDGFLTEEDIERAILPILHGTPNEGNSAEVIRELVDRALLRTWREDRERRYRSRFAELVRLLVRCRQWFPNRSWSTAPPLVADFRFCIQPRRYPRRDIRRDEAWAHLQRSATLTSFQQTIWNTLLPADSKLARFQVDAGLRLVGRSMESGTIVTAGTGSGKTLAFYIPVFTSLSEEITAQRYVKALAIYPRQELLKDQLTEALRLATRIAPALRAAGRRPLSIAAYFGGAPRNSDEEELVRQGWSRRSGGLLFCPLVRCPTCGGDMAWRPEARSREREVLTCLLPSCGTETDPDVLSLTRASITRRPPDVLFTTTEMMNQRLSDLRVRHLFGAGKQYGQRPRFLLLDEVHTYAGLAGAQTGLLLRRWRRMVNAPVTWVGLSATLREAEQFFAALSGLRPDQVAEITPHASDMEEEGAEYQLILRTDPSSQTSTLSTSIQSIMLLGRMLDARGTAFSHGRFGRRLFAFTDDLDATNRLFDNLRDAEAYDRFGRPDAHRRPLAALRETGAVDDALRETAGQRWALAEQLRGSLETRLLVSRTSSRDQGVDMAADVIVATSALEVGFNDPDVGAVLQHKAPRGVASFLQRRGRAGRRRGMRPLAITVLSDYGRDRLAFQNYELLFDPTVPRQVLPVRNTYVLRMQAVYSLLDWIAHKAGLEGAEGWSWESLAAPPRDNSRSAFGASARRLLQRLVQLDSSAIAELSDFLMSSLHVDEATLRVLLWDPPRALLTEAVPTLARRLFRDWALAGAEGVDLCIPYHPLPDFVPRALFAELTLPEIHIDLPPSRQGEERVQEPMQVLQALQQFAPGRVRRRFADEYGGLAHWVPIDTGTPMTVVQLDRYAPRREYVDTYPGSYDGRPQHLPVYRPWVIEAARAQEAEVLPTSNSQWRWQTNLEPRGQPFVLSTPNGTRWSQLMPHVDFYLHRFSAAVSIARFAAEGTADVRKRNGNSLVRFRLRDTNDEPAAVGFAYEADGLVIPLNLPSAEALNLSQLRPETERWLRTMRIRDAVLETDTLPEEVNSFQREWLFLAVLFAALVKAEADSIDLSRAVRDVLGKQDAERVRAAIADIVGGADSESTPDDDGDTKLETTLDALLDQRVVRDAIADVFCEVLASPDRTWRQWLQSRLSHTLAEAVLQACLIAAPENTALEGLFVEMLTRDGQPSILVSESTMGGGGTLEVLAHSFALEPRSFFRALEAALAPTDLESAAESMIDLINVLHDHPSVAEKLAELRAASGHEGKNAARRRFVGALTAHGVSVDHALTVSIAIRLLRPGASADSDLILRDLISRRDSVAAKYSVGIPYRIAALLMTTIDSDLRERVAQLGGTARAASVADLLMWPEAGEVRAKSLQAFNPFKPTGVTDSSLVKDLLTSTSDVVTVMLNDSAWRAKAEAALVTHGSVRLAATRGGEADIRACLLPLLGEPISSGYLQFFATLESISRQPDGSVAAALVLREQV